MNAKKNTIIGIIIIILLLFFISILYIKLNNQNKKLVNLNTKIENLSKQFNSSENLISDLQKDNDLLKETIDHLKAKNDKLDSKKTAKNYTPKVNSFKTNTPDFFNLCKEAYNNTDYSKVINYANLTDLYNDIDKNKKSNINILKQKSEKILDLKQKADTEFYQKKFESALVIYKKITKINPKDSESQSRVEECKMTFSNNSNFVLVKEGDFLMGNPDTTIEYSKDERPVHSVKLNSFYLSKYEVTNEQFARFLNSYGNDNIVKGGKFAGSEMVAEHDWGVKKINNKWEVAKKGYEKHPVQNVSWYGAYEFCRFYGFRLPTEAEWEYAAIGAKQKAEHKYAGSNNLEEVAWSLENSKTTNPVGVKKPNQLGLYDMSGNVYEWCYDWYKSYNEKSNSDNQNPEVENTQSQFYKIIRGGSWGTENNDARVQFRNFVSPFFKYEDLGFRFAKSVNQEENLVINK